MPGTASPPFADEERWAAVLGDAVDGLESFQVPIPNQAVEDILQQIKFVRRELLKRVPKEIDHGQTVGE
jgi:hypothetical protein